MFLLEPQETAFDLRFRIFGIPVRVHPMFWLISAVLGWDFIRLGLGYVLLWVGCTFVSILIHELGHVFMSHAFGNRRHIVLYSFGGLAIASQREPHRWQRIAVSFAGPLAGFLFFGLVVLVREFGLPVWDPDLQMPVLWIALFMLWEMNLFWNLLNLVPVWPLDGGQISREVLTGLTPRNGLRLSLGISFLIAGLLAVHSLLAERGEPLLPFLPFGDMYMALFFALLALESFFMLQQAQAQQRGWDDEDRPWRREPW